MQAGVSGTVVSVASAQLEENRRITEMNAIQPHFYNN